MTALLSTLTIVASLPFTYASAHNMIGSYSVPTAVRFFGYTELDCKQDGGKLVGDACIIPSTNTISIEKNEQQQIIVKVEVIYGPANMREFSGVVVKTKGNTLDVVEADVDDDNRVGAIQKSGCRLTLSLKSKSLTIVANNQCDKNLLRANGAKKN